MNINPRYAIWREVAGPDAKNWQYIAFIWRMSDAYLADRGVKRITDQDDFTAFIRENASKAA